MAIGENQISYQQMEERQHTRKLHEHAFEAVVGATAAAAAYKYPDIREVVGAALVYVGSGAVAVAGVKHFIQEYRRR